MCSTLVRIVDIDYYISSPIQDIDVTYSEFRSSSILHVPVLRVFGSTQTGQKICIHVHGVFPYIYLPYDGVEHASSLSYQIAANIDRALNISMGQTSSNSQHVYKVSLVSGIPFYGYHTKQHQYFKIYLYNPMLVKRVTSLLENNSVLGGKLYQPHEAHLSFVLQFMIDYNLHGMNYMVVSSVAFRSPNTVTTDTKTGWNMPPKASCCELEGDILAEHILNRKEIENGNFAINPGIAALWADEKQRRRNNRGDSQMKSQFLSLENTNVPPTKSHEIFKAILLARLEETSQDVDSSGDFNQSVYAAETPADANITSASQAVNHLTPSPGDLDASLIADFDVSTLDSTLDPEAKGMLEILENLAQDNSLGDLEKDSILSQLEENEEGNADELDLSISLEASQDVTLVPQFDGGMETDLTSVSQRDGSSQDVDMLTSRDLISRNLECLPVICDCKKQKCVKHKYEYSSRKFGVHDKPEKNLVIPQVDGAFHLDSEEDNGFLKEYETWNFKGIPLQNMNKVDFSGDYAKIPRNNLKHNEVASFTSVYRRHRKMKKQKLRRNQEISNYKRNSTRTKFGSEDILKSPVSGENFYEADRVKVFGNVHNKPSTTTEDFYSYTLGNLDPKIVEKRPNQLTHNSLQTTLSPPRKFATKGVETNTGESKLRAKISEADTVFLSSHISQIGVRKSSTKRGEEEESAAMKKNDLNDRVRSKQLEDANSLRTPTNFTTRRCEEGPNELKLLKKNSTADTLLFSAHVNQIGINKNDTKRKDNNIVMNKYFLNYTAFGVDKTKQFTDSTSLRTKVSKRRSLPTKGVEGSPEESQLFENVSKADMPSWSPKTQILSDTKSEREEEISMDKHTRVEKCPKQLANSTFLRKDRCELRNFTTKMVEESPEGSNLLENLFKVDSHSSLPNNQQSKKQEKSLTNKLFFSNKSVGVDNYPKQLTDSNFLLTGFSVPRNLTAKDVLNNESVGRKSQEELKGSTFLRTDFSKPRNVITKRLKESKSSEKNPDTNALFTSPQMTRILTRKSGTKSEKNKTVIGANFLNNRSVRVRKSCNQLKDPRSLEAQRNFVPKSIEEESEKRSTPDELLFSLLRTQIRENHAKNEKDDFGGKKSVRVEKLIKEQAISLKTMFTSHGKCTMKTVEKSPKESEWWEKNSKPDVPLPAPLHIQIQITENDTKSDFVNSKSVRLEKCGKQLADVTLLRTMHIPPGKCTTQRVEECLEESEWSGKNSKSDALLPSPVKTQIQIMKDDTKNDFVNRPVRMEKCGKRTADSDSLRTMSTSQRKCTTKSVKKRLKESEWWQKNSTSDTLVSSHLKTQIRIRENDTKSENDDFVNNESVSLEKCGKQFADSTSLGMMSSSQRKCTTKSVQGNPKWREKNSTSHMLVSLPLKSQIRIRENNTKMENDDFVNNESVSLEKCGKQLADSTSLGTMSTSQRKCTTKSVKESPKDTEWWEKNSIPDTLVSLPLKSQIRIRENDTKSENDNFINNESVSLEKCGKQLTDSTSLGTMSTSQRKCTTKSVKESPKDTEWWEKNSTPHMLVSLPLKSQIRIRENDTKSENDDFVKSESVSLEKCGKRLADSTSLGTMSTSQRKCTTKSAKESPKDTEWWEKNSIPDSLVSLPLKYQIRIRENDTKSENDDFVNSESVSLEKCGKQLIDSISLGTMSTSQRKCTTKSVQNNPKETKWWEKNSTPHMLVSLPLKSQIRIRENDTKSENDDFVNNKTVSEEKCGKQLADSTSLGTMSTSQRKCTTKSVQNNPKETKWWEKNFTPDTLVSLPLKSQIRIRENDTRSENDFLNNELVSTEKCGKQLADSTSLQTVLTLPRKCTTKRVEESYEESEWWEKNSKPDTLPFSHLKTQIRIRENDTKSDFVHSEESEVEKCSKQLQTKRRKKPIMKKVKKSVEESTFLEKHSEAGTLLPSQEISRIRKRKSDTKGSRSKPDHLDRQSVRKRINSNHGFNPRASAEGNQTVADKTTNFYFLRNRSLPEENVGPKFVPDEKDAFVGSKNSLIKEEGSQVEVDLNSEVNLKLQDERLNIELDKGSPKVFLKRLNVKYEEGELASFKVNGNGCDDLIKIESEISDANNSVAVPQLMNSQKCKQTDTKLPAREGRENGELKSHRLRNMPSLSGHFDEVVETPHVSQARSELAKRVVKRPKIRRSIKKEKKPSRLSKFVAKFCKESTRRFNLVNSGVPPIFKVSSAWRKYDFLDLSSLVSIVHFHSEFRGPLPVDGIDDCSSSSDDDRAGSIQDATRTHLDRKRVWSRSSQSPYNALPIEVFSAEAGPSNLNVAGRKSSMKKLPSSTKKNQERNREIEKIKRKIGFHEDVTSETEHLECAYVRKKSVKSAVLAEAPKEDKQFVTKFDENTKTIKPFLSDFETNQEAREELNAIQHFKGAVQNDQKRVNVSLGLDDAATHNEARRVDHQYQNLKESCGLSQDSYERTGLESRECDEIRLPLGKTGQLPARTEKLLTRNNTELRHLCAEPNKEPDKINKCAEVETLGDLSGLVGNTKRLLEADVVPNNSEHFSPEPNYDRFKNNEFPEGELNRLQYKAIEEEEGVDYFRARNVLETDWKWSEFSPNIRNEELGKIQRRKQIEDQKLETREQTPKSGRLFTDQQASVAQQSEILQVATSSKSDDFLDVKDNIYDILFNSPSQGDPSSIAGDSQGPKFLTCTPLIKPPSRREVERSFPNVSAVKHQEAFYGKPEDVTGMVEIGYNVLKIGSKSAVHAQEFVSSFSGLNAHREQYLEKINFETKNTLAIKLSFCQNNECVITPLGEPPSRTEAEHWLKTERDQPPEDDLSEDQVIDSQASEISIKECSGDSFLQLSPVLAKRRLKPRKRKRVSNSYEITGKTLNNTYGFDGSIEQLQNARALSDCHELTTLTMEVHVQTRGDFNPDPKLDPIRAIFYSILNDVSSASEEKPKRRRGCFVVDSSSSGRHLLDGIGINCDVKYCASEEDMIGEFADFVRFWDPDILIGYEIEMLSWGYLVERSYVIGINLPPLLSRVPDKVAKSKDGDRTREEKFVGRILLDFWRLLRHEIALQSYTFENIVYHLLHKRIPHYAFKNLSFWWEHPTNHYRHRTVDYYFIRVDGILELLDNLDFIGRTTELARLFGILFFEVLSRGSQFRVESMMLRLAKPLNYIAVSPSVKQRAHMRAPEYIALVLEPESKFYVDPVLVLDFQSLYPSLIIAYNYCFSTCLGRVQCLGQGAPFEFGATMYKIAKSKVEKLAKSDRLNYSPCGVAFVKNNVRDGILPRMLREILDTRLMVKNSMKENKGDPILRKVLDNRQLGLKLIANVTYGYTSANFSGRMPSVEVADSVISKGRETLHRAITMVDNTPEWGARVVYGDTDSIFVLLAGKSKEEAFDIGQKIAEAVTRDNPDPIKLKFEKVYYPCILQTKKRYVGYKYESLDQKEPVFDAKGIETVRRDGCPAVSKMLEKCLRLLFDTKDVSLIKSYVLRQFEKIISGRISIQDLTFAKEYRGASGYKPIACVPALELARKWTAVDKRKEPRSGERVPYVIVNGPPGLPLIKLVRSPMELLQDTSLRPNAIYYITHVIIPPINRCFNLIGADLLTWFSNMPRKQQQYLPVASPGKKNTISQYFASNICAVCGVHTHKGLCDKCEGCPQSSVALMFEKIKLWESSYDDCKMICQSCTLTLEVPKCVSLDCPVLYRLFQTRQELQQSDYVRGVIKQFFD